MYDEIPQTVAQGINPDGTVRMGSDSQLIVVFYKRAVQNEFLSKQQGTPQYESKDFVKIYQPGEKDFIDRPVKDSDKFRFAQQWNRYQQNQEQVSEGTPLDHLFPGNPEIVATLRALHIQTVQQLANLTDTSCSTLQFGDSLRKKAKTYLEGAEKGKTFHTLEKRIQEQDAEIKELREQMKAIIAAQDEDEDKPRRRKAVA